LIVAGFASNVTIRVAGAAVPRPRPAAGGACPWGAWAAVETTAHQPNNTATSNPAINFFNTRQLYRLPW